jgi:hypothetical protein
MLESLKPKGGKRWPRGQKFAITSSGLAAAARYREAVQLARGGGRNALEVAQEAWAASFGAKAGDGVVLGELSSGKHAIADVARALDSCGTTLADVKASVDRLVELGLVEPVTQAQPGEAA